MTADPDPARPTQPADKASMPPWRAPLGGLVRRLAAGVAVLVLGAGAGWLARSGGIGLAGSAELAGVAPPVGPGGAVVAVAQPTQPALTATPSPVPTATPSATASPSPTSRGSPTASPAPAVRTPGSGRAGPAISPVPTAKGRAWLGLTVDDGPNGVTVRGVIPGGPGERAGLRQGDVITAVDGQPVRSVADVRRQLRDRQAGDTLTLTVNRGGTSLDVDVVVQPVGPAPLLPAVPVPKQPKVERDVERLFGVPGIDALQGVPDDQRFDHLLGVQYTVLDAQGRRVTYQTVPGRVTAVAAGSLTIQPNDPTQHGSFTVTAGTRLLGGRGLHSVDQLTPGDRVIVVTEGSAGTALAVFVPRTTLPAGPAPARPVPSPAAVRPVPSPTPTR